MRWIRRTTWRDGSPFFPQFTKRPFHGQRAPAQCCLDTIMKAGASSTWLRYHSTASRACWPSVFFFSLSQTASSSLKLTRGPADDQSVLRPPTTPFPLLHCPPLPFFSLFFFPPFFFPFFFFLFFFFFFFSFFGSSPVVIGKASFRRFSVC